MSIFSFTNIDVIYGYRFYQSLAKISQNPTTTLVQTRTPHGKWSLSLWVNHYYRFAVSRGERCFRRVFDSPETTDRIGPFAHPFWSTHTRGADGDFVLSNHVEIKTPVDTPVTLVKGAGDNRPGFPHAFWRRLRNKKKIKNAHAAGSCGTGPNRGNRPAADKSASF